MKNSKEITSVMNMAYSLDLVPVETDTENEKMLVLGRRGNLFTVTFNKIKEIYSLYLANGLDSRFILNY